VKWVKVRGARWSRCDPTLVRTKLSLLYIYSVPEPLGTLYGDTAVNTGYYTLFYTKDGEAKSIPARYSFTYVKDGNDCKSGPSLVRSASAVGRPVAGPIIGDITATSRGS
jgi:hypothetical protein